MRHGDRGEGGHRDRWIESRTCDQAGEVDTVIGTLVWPELDACEVVPTFVGGEGPQGRSLWQFPNSPGRQREQGMLFLTQEHLRHLAVPLQRQQQVTGPLRRGLMTRYD